MKLQIEISPIELKEIFNYFDSEPITEHEIKPISYPKKKSVLFYDNSLFDIIKVDDTIEVLPSENCVTNTDKIKYDEIISGEPGVVYNIYPEENKVTVFVMGKYVDVHPSWIKRLKK